MEAPPHLTPLCPHCGAPVSNTAAYCPNCGYTFATGQRKMTGCGKVLLIIVLTIVGLAVLIFGACVLILTVGNQPSRP